MLLRLPILFMLVVPLLSSRTAYADPITLHYEVTVDKRMDVQGANPWIPIDPITFQLTMTFDGDETGRGVTLSEPPDDASAQSHWVTHFGPATFSEVPLPGGERLAGGQGFTRIFNSMLGSLPFQGAQAGTEVTGTTLLLITRGGLVPPLAPGEFGTLDTFLRAMGGSNIEFFYSNGPAFGGFASAVEIADPVPEPGTLTLVGTTVFLTALRRRRRSLVASHRCSH
jgi:hypothetical protein